MKTLCLLALCLILSPCAFAFELRNVAEVSQNAYLRWDLTSGPISISLDGKGSDDLQFSKTEQTVLSALSLWQNVSGQNVTFQYAGISNVQTHSGSDGLNSIEWIESGWAYSSYTLAVTSYSYYVDDPPTLIDADIMMNGQNYKWAIVGADNEQTFDAEQTLIHELGHALGIGHSSVVNARMFPYITGDPRRRLSKDDKQALRFLYGAQPASFSLWSPVHKARYINGISSKGLPLPVFRWTPVPTANYVIEFSSTANFARRIQISAGPYLFYELTPSIEKKLLNLSAVDRIFWRVRSGNSVTPTRWFYFI